MRPAPASPSRTHRTTTTPSPWATRSACTAGASTGSPPAEPGGSPAPARERTVVLLGHEHRGVPDAVLVGADERVEIPMIGRDGSLNVAVAGSLVAYRLAGLA